MTTYNPNLSHLRFLVTELIVKYYGDNLECFIVDGGSYGALSSNTSFSHKLWSNFGGLRTAIFGMEGDQSSSERSNIEAKSLGLNCKYFPYGLWNSKHIKNLFVTQDGGGSSMFPPHYTLINYFTYGSLSLGEAHKTKHVLEVQTTDLDSWKKEHDIPDIDFIKLNIQGAELAALEGATNTLDSVVCIQLEGSYIDQYVGAPLFSEIDIFLRRSGFTLFDIVSTGRVGQSLSPIKVNTHETADFGWPRKRLLESHFLYVRDLIADAEKNSHHSAMPKEKWLKLACILEVYGHIEYSFALVVWLRQYFERNGDQQDALKMTDIIREASEGYSSGRHIDRTKNDF